MKEEWDVVVVGAGPAGATAAREAAMRGARVLLIDKAKFPRYKTCGGGLIGASVKHVPVAVRVKTTQSQPTVAIFSRAGQRSLTRTEPTPFVSMVNREEFDDALVREAIAAGADFLDGVRASAIHQDEREAQLKTNRGLLRATWIVGADGCGGLCGRYVGVNVRRTDLGLEYELPMPASRSDWERTVYLDWGRPTGSYGWVFPKRDHLTVGVIQRRGFPAETRDYLAKWVSTLGLDEIQPSRSSGHLTQWRSGDSPMRRGRVLIAGETAGLLEPWTREGISFAIRSGAAAGAATAKALRVTGGRRLVPVIEYERYVTDRLMPEILAGRKLLEIYERRPLLVDSVLSNYERAARFFMNYCRGDKDFATSIPRRALSTVHWLLA